MNSLTATTYPFYKWQWIFSFLCRFFLSPIADKTWRMTYKICLSFTINGCIPGVFVRFVLTIILVFCAVVCPCIAHSVLSNVYLMHVYVSRACVKLLCFYSCFAFLQGISLKRLKLYSIYFMESEIRINIYLGLKQKHNTQIWSYQHQLYALYLTLWLGGYIWRNSMKQQKISQTDIWHKKNIFPSQVQKSYTQTWYHYYWQLVERDKTMNAIKQTT